MMMMMTTKRFVTIVFDSIVGVTPGQEGRAGGGAALFHILIAVVIITITITIIINIVIAKDAFIHSLFVLSQLKKKYLLVILTLMPPYLGKVSRKKVAVVGGNLDKIQKNSYFFFGNPSQR